MARLLCRPCPFIICYYCIIFKRFRCRINVNKKTDVVPVHEVYENGRKVKSSSFLSQVPLIFYYRFDFLRDKFCLAVLHNAEFFSQKFLYFLLFVLILMRARYQDYYDKKIISIRSFALKHF